MVFGTGSIRRVVVIHLDRGEDVLESLRQIVRAEQIRNGVILTGYGTLDRFSYHAVTTAGLPPQDRFVTVERPLEIVGIHGVIADGEIHAHIAVADLERGFGGHLEPGCRVLYLCDVVIGEVDGVDMRFETRPETGLRLLNVSPGHEVPGPRIDGGPGGPRPEPRPYTGRPGGHE
ncbi:MAG: PPC domain-containing DNA-binding protein [Bacillota bacterium]